MTLRETTLRKLHQLPESVLQEVSDFIDSLLNRQSNNSVLHRNQGWVKEIWIKYLQSLDKIMIFPPKSEKNYGQLLLDKYRKKGLEL